MADPLVLVRDFNTSKRIALIKDLGDSVDFNGLYLFKKSAPTSFRTARNDYTTLDVVLYVLRTRELPQPQYLTQAAQDSVPSLAFADRRKLLRVLDGEEQIEAGAAVPVAQLVDLEGAQPEAKRPRLGDAEGSVFDERYTRQLRDRNTMLLAPNKDFKQVLKIAEKEYAKLSTQLKQQQKAAEEAKRKQQQAAAAKQAGQQAKSSHRFDRDTTTEGFKAFGGEGAPGLGSVIQMYGETDGDAAGARAHAANGSARPAPPPPPAGAPGSSGRHHKDRAPPPPQPSGRSASHRHASSSQPSRHAPPAPPGRAPAPAVDAKRLTPVIIVPSGLTAMINMYNARAFLEDGRYEPAGAIAASGVPKPSSITINRTAGKPAGERVEYTVTDKAPEKKDKAGWDQVAAVIVQGAKWQFKDWPFKGIEKGDMAYTFQQVAGFYIHFSDDKVPETVSNWNVKRLGLAREKRHMDAPLMLDFYRHLDAFLTAKQSQLKF